MAFMAAALPYLQAAGAAMTIIGGINQADNMRSTAAANAENARRSAEINKQQLDYRAGQEAAAGQHEAEAARRKSMLMLSRAQAIAAASGGGPLDETLMKGLVGEGEKAAGASIYTSTESAKGLRFRGEMGAYEANARSIADIESANRQADATILGSFAKAAPGLSGFMPSAPPGLDSLNSFDDGSMAAAMRR